MRRAPAILIAALMCACSHSPLKIESQALVNPADQSPERFIIAAVANDSGALLARAGTTPSGYDSIAAYGPTSRARRTMKSLEDEYGLREVSAWPIEPLHMHCAVLRLPDGADRGALLASLLRDPRILLAQPLQTFATRSGDYNDPYVALQRGFQQMHVSDAHRWSRGEGVKVAIIDTGVDTRHPDLAGSVAAAVNFVDSDAAQFRRDRHGTEVAGVIAAVANNREGIVGVAPEARLLVYKACWQEHAGADAALCNSFTLARAMAAAMAAHAQIINLSLAGPDDVLLSDLIREGLRRGILFIGAAAAEMPEGKAALLHQAGVIEVASEEDHASQSTALYAPGREILTLLPDGHYDFASGDSMATAQVTGVVSLMMAKRRELSAADAYQILRATSAPLGAEQREHVDACAAMAALLGLGACQQSADTEHRLAEKHDVPAAPH
jgi:hypothetical protein